MYLFNRKGFISQITERKQKFQLKYSIKLLVTPQRDKNKLLRPQCLKCFSGVVTYRNPIRVRVATLGVTGVFNVFLNDGALSIFDRN